MVRLNTSLRWMVGLASLLTNLNGCQPSAPPVSVVPAVPKEPKGPAGRTPVEDMYGVNDPAAIQFRDDAASNATPDPQLVDLAFVDLAGKKVSLGDYVGKKNLVLVITRGSARYVCVYCSTQTSRLVAQYPEFTKRDAEVLVVFPLKAAGDHELADDFLKFVKQKLPSSTAEIPFPLVLDVELKGVDQLGLRHNLSRPATYILDKQGQVRFAYVGETEADRPSVKSMLAQLDEIQGDTPTRPATTELK